MLITPADASTLVTAAVTGVEDEVKAAYGTLSATALDVANDDSMLLPDRARLLLEATEMLRNTLRGIVPGVVPTLAPATPVAALGAGTPTLGGTIDPADQALLDQLEMIANTLGGATREQALTRFEQLVVDIMRDPATTRGKSLALSAVANGTLVVNDDGTANTDALDAEIATLRSQLATANADLSTANTENATLTGERDTARTEKQAAEAARDAMQAERDNAVNAVTPITNERDELLADFAELDTAVNGNRTVKGKVARLLSSASARLKSRLPQSLA